MTTTPTTSKKRRAHWGLIIVALLAVHATCTILAVTVAVDDPNFYVPKDYYEQAVNYDQRKDALHRSAELGWTLTIRAGSLTDEQGRRFLEVELRDKAGLAASDANITVNLKHHAGGREQQAVELTTNENGVGRTLAPMPRRGMYRLDTTVTRGSDVFIDRRDVEVGVVAVAPPDAEGPGKP